jgi:hypothetical protein
MPEWLSELINDPARAKLIASCVDLILKLFFGIIGLYFAHSLGRHVALKISEKRLQAYSRLWAVTRDASPTRLKDGGEGPLNSQERKALHESMQNWYYECGNGMLLAKGTRTMFLKVKDNLVLPAKDLEPESFSVKVQKAKENEVNDVRGRQSIRQLSLLRTRMKSDFRIFGIPYGGELTPSDKEFLKHCGQKLWKKPWRRIL